MRERNNILKWIGTSVLILGTGKQSWYLSINKSI